ncbi:MAG: lysophospholipid acyltransferase family protein [Propionibacteriaceae bacterium]
MAEAEVIQLGSRGRAGRGSRSSPSVAARGLAGAPRPRTRKPASRPEPAEDADQSETSATRRQKPVKPDSSAEPCAEPESEPCAEPESEPCEEPEPERTTPEPETLRGPEDETRERSSTFAQPALDLAALLGELGSAFGGVLDQLRGFDLDRLHGLAADPLAGALQLLGRFGFDLGEPAEGLAEFARSRFRGDYAIDEFGFDPEFTERVFLPLLRPLVHSWFRVDVRGTENLPEDGSALLVANHAGTMPLDGMVLHSVVHEEIGRHVRMLGADLIFATPYSHDLARKTGTTLACAEDTERLLAGDQLVAVFPEGFKGLGKLYADRYKLQRFGRGGFVSAAVRAQVPIIPVSIVGSEEIYPLLSRAPSLARALGVPYFPITPLFPWFGLLGMVPLPSKWVISFGEAIATDELPPGSAEDPMVVFNVTDQVRETIQQTLYAQLVQRRSAFR